MPKTLDPGFTERLKNSLINTPAIRVTRGWYVTGYHDMVEGRGGTFYSSFHLDKNLAEAAARGAGPSGSTAAVGEIMLAVFHTGIATGSNFAFCVPLEYFYEQSPPPSVKERALAKLTHDEKVALGLVKP